MKANIKKLLETAAQTGVCGTGKRYLDTHEKDVHTLVKVIKGWPEYFYEHSETVIDTIRENLDEQTRDHLEFNNIFVDHQGEAQIDWSDTAVYFMGNSDVTVRMKPFAVLKIYTFNQAKVTIHPAENAFISVEAWNNSAVIIHPEETAQASLYLYDQAQGTGAAKIKRKAYKRDQVFNGREETPPE